eukprot:2560562-Amphidinium_carterae.2
MNGMRDAKVTEKTASLIAAASTYVEKREAKWNLLLRPVKVGPHLPRSMDIPYTMENTTALPYKESVRHSRSSGCHFNG